jgi:hypothetical protein
MLLQAESMAEHFDKAMSALLQAAEDAIASLPASGSQQQPDPALVEQLQAAERAVLAADAATSGAAQGPDRVAVVQPAADLARLLQQYWQMPEQQAAARLEQAQAAATRSCAYLACANLGGSGGPAAGEGEGSKKCSVCRVSYCGEACSHADWQAGGHRKVCQALAAERQAQMEEERAQQQQQQQ